MAILSVSRRTDIPKFYSDWFFNAIRRGDCIIQNPKYPTQLYNVNLKPDVIDCIVFWTKDPSPMLDRLDELSDYNYYFQYTLNNYSTKYEPNSKSLEDSIETFKQLSNKIGAKNVIWRYDPIFISTNVSIQHHIESFELICRELENFTNRCVISFIDLYGFVVNRVKHLGIRSLNKIEIHEILHEFNRISKEYNIGIETCAEEWKNIDYDNIKHGSCIDKSLIESNFNIKLGVNKDNSQRELCGCIESIDIGVYDTCKHGCVYCYATNHVTKLNHNPESRMLLGEYNGEKLLNRKIVSKRI